MSLHVILAQEPFPSSLYHSKFSIYSTEVSTQSLCMSHCAIIIVQGLPLVAKLFPAESVSCQNPPLGVPLVRLVGLSLGVV